MPGHVPTFRAITLPPGYADCAVCGGRIRREDWAAGICPGKLTAQAEQRRTA